MTHQSFSLIFLIALFPTSSSGISLDRFLPYGTTHGDTEMERGDDTGSPALQLSVPFPFFDTLYSTLWVNVNGAISFAKQISKYTPVCGPVEREYSSIAPFWADADISYTGHIFYRQSTVPQSLEKAQEEISSSFPNFAGIKLKWLLVATWLNVTDSPDCSHCAQKRNTFQAIITTDGRHSFAIFYYQNLMWTTGADSGGTDGLGGTPAQAGFDFGDGTHRLMIPGSCSGDVLKINEQSNVGDPGKWVFRVDRAVKPKIVDMTPDDVLLEIPEDDSLNLTCRAVGHTVPSIKWRVNGTDMNCMSPDCQQVSENGTGTLTLENVKRENGGIYTCVAFDEYDSGTIPRKDWVVKIVGRKPKEIPQKFRGSWTLDHDINFDAYLFARYGENWLGTGLAAIGVVAKLGMMNKKILKNPDGSYDWDNLYYGMVLGEEFDCTSINCIGEDKRIVFRYLPANETLIETHKPYFKPVFDYKYTVDDGLLVMRMEWDNVKAKLFYRKKA
ncbi:nidogen-like domain-containing protein [Ditylenchus destructor]|uniref:Nidogen-like domain-containing protein n=1 Tax=Ditylenchus destructor TaxID=166010 RepID=A0AAD4MXJ5_9BILA|nr:nidogen-like domain-containing protein [Ditylenchus destructor]